MDREVLFLRKTDDEIRIWEGDRLSREEGKECSGIQQVQWTASFEAVLGRLMIQAEKVFLNSNEHLRADRLVED
jgi:Xaa-Pro aminopeptidase